MDTMDEPVRAELMGTRVIVWDTADGNKLYKLGFYGKPVGIPKPKPNQEFTVPLMLDLIEALHLSEKKIIRIVAPQNGKTVKKATLLTMARRMHKGFDDAYSVYQDLRGKGYIVTPGIKFGADFAVYEHGPGIDHAPFIISVRRHQETLSTFDIVRAGRLATTVRKQFIIAMPEGRSRKINYLMFRWFKA